MRGRASSGLVGEAVVGSTFGGDHGVTGQRRQVRIAVERVDEPSGELRSFGVFGEPGQRLRIVAE